MTVIHAALSFDVGSNDKIQLLPASDFRAIDGRPNGIEAWRINKTIAAKVIAASTTTNPLPIDYDHATQSAPKTGIKAPAAGWMSNLHWIENLGLFANVNWTEKAREFIKKGEYKFISPVMQFNPTTGEVVKILMAGLVNNPAIQGMMPAVALSAQIKLTDTEIEVCRAMNLSHADFIKNKLKNA